MATLYDKILLARPNLTADDFMPDGDGTIVLQNDATTPPAGKVFVGQDYIRDWSHATETIPTQAEIDGV
jgi:hypothetical protein